ncbi:hypothetical protein EGT36_08445 [Agrobacterium sp. FDAARGOS_525]|nr:hypothetical protein EGT36_08445 [Agrobacterium sp. FDAARGOS_525]
MLKAVFKSAPFCDRRMRSRKITSSVSPTAKSGRGLKRWLRQQHWMSWQDCLRVFDLPRDYSSICPALSRKKSEDAIRNRLGRNPEPSASQPEPATHRLRPQQGYRNRFPPFHFQHKISD